MRCSTRKSENLQDTTLAPMLHDSALPALGGTRDGIFRSDEKGGNLKVENSVASESIISEGI